MASLPKHKIKNRFLLFLAVVVAFVAPLTLLILGVFIFRQTNPVIKINPGEEIKTEERLIPSQVLSNKAKYHQQEVVIRGRASPEPVVCERKECPTNDSCCGCPVERDLILADAGKVLTSQEGAMRLIEAGKSLCQRRQYSCDYDCGDWLRGAIYDVNGKFFAESPPPGWKLSLNYYFQVESKNLVKKVSLSETFNNFFSEIKNRLNNLKTSGQYVLP